MKNYSTSPLPFQGQKRNFVKPFKEALKQYPDNATYVDLFGGSGLLAHNVKQAKPNTKVIYNDYDGFSLRLACIDITNAILDEIRPLTNHLPRKVGIPENVKHQILEIFKKYEAKGFVDYITLSGSLLFSMNYAKTLDEFKKQKFYNRVRKTNFTAKGYLQDVEVVKYDYKQLFDRFKDVPNVVFLVDPPYLSTDCQTYNSSYWKLKDYLDVLTVLVDHNYFYFTSNKSSIVELMEWIETNTAAVSPFNGAEVVYHYNSTTHNTGYTDIMLHKGWTTTTT